MNKELNKFLKWVDEKTTFFQDKDVTTSQVVREYLNRNPKMDKVKKLKQALVSGSFRKENYWSVKCADCGTMFCESENEYDLFPTKQDAIEQVTEFDWSIKGNTALCDNCR